jgi:hypothetical protein
LRTGFDSLPGYFLGVTDILVMDDRTTKSEAEADNLREAVKIGKDVAKTTLVWTLAGVATKVIRDLIIKIGIRKS